AHDAGVGFYIDTNILHSDKRVQEFWRRGLAEVDQMSRERSDGKFTDLDAAAQSELVSTFLANERSPETTLEQFALQLKNLTIEGYCVSEVGMKYFGYRGNTGISEFPGCTHPEHKSTRDPEGQITFSALIVIRVCWLWFPEIPIWLIDWELTSCGQKNPSR